ncbi:MAG: lipoate--protein ligase family protein [Anaerolineae bacterium]
MRQWRLIYDKPMFGAYNMAIDEAIMQAVGQGDAPPTLRLYAWEPLCLSLGYGQRLRDVDQERLHGQRWHLIRRPTGGKAILHGDELTYSVALPQYDELAQGDVVESYRRISEALINSLQSLGVSPRSEKQAKGNRDLGPVCFEVPSHYEITADGKKLIGSAQVRRRQGILQHGTLPLHGDITRICEVLAYADETERAHARQQVAQRATTLGSVLGHDVDWQTVAEALVQGFTQTFDIQFQQSQLTPEEQNTVARFLDERYHNAGWLAKR